MLFGGKGLDKIELWQTCQKSEDFLGFQKGQNHRNGEVTFDTSFYISQRIRASEKLVSSKIRSFYFHVKGISSKLCVIVSWFTIDDENQ